MRILVIEDSQRLQQSLTRLLASQYYSVDAISTGGQGIFMAQTNSYDLIILDLMLPDMEGFEVCRRLRQEMNATPILMLTALTDVDSKIRGLDTGADDYLAKPFHTGELLARVRALCRRDSGQKDPTMKAGGLELNTVTRTAARNGLALDLSAKELALLEYLMMRKNKIVTREEILEHVWDMNFDPRSNVVDALIKLLRKKVDEAYESKLIHTIRGIGYILKDE